jgi:hypothetical protein
MEHSRLAIREKLDWQYGWFASCHDRQYRRIFSQYLDELNYLIVCHVTLLLSASTVGDVADVYVSKQHGKFRN